MSTVSITPFAGLSVAQNSLDKHNDLMRWNFDKYFDTNYWTNLFKGNSFWQRWVSKIIRVIVASINGFFEDNCSSKASALTFYSLLSIVPGLAVAFGIAKGFGFEGPLESELLQKFSEQREIAEKLIAFAYNMLENTKGGVIAGVGLLVLFWSVLQLLSSIEISFNSIWKISRPRSFSRRFSDYLAMILFCPLFFAAASSIFVFIVAQLTQLTENNGLLDTLGPIVVFIFYLSPLIIAWILFTSLYYVMPNTKVPILSALVAGIIAGTFYQIVQVLYIRFQISLASYGAIYGSFAALPLFLIWLNTSWLIALIGAEIAYHAEMISFSSVNDGKTQFHADARILGLLIMKNSLEAFHDGSSPPSLYELSQRLGVGIPILRQIIRKLVDANLLVEARWHGGITTRYLPACLPESITFKTVCDALDTARERLYWIAEAPLTTKYQEILNAIDNLVEEAPINHPLYEKKLIGERTHGDV